MPPVSLDHFPASDAEAHRSDASIVKGCHMSTVTISPCNIRQFGRADGEVFCLVTNPEIAGKFSIKKGDGYTGYEIIPFQSGEVFQDVLDERIPEKAHVLVISPYAFFQSPKQETLGAQRKLIAMACNSTPTDFDTIAHFLGVLERTDPDAQEAFADRFFELGSNAHHLLIEDPVNATQARFDHQDESYFWSEQAGRIDYGQQQLAPPGEISVLPLRITDFDEALDLEVNGTIALMGYPILHNGTPSFQRTDQARLHTALSTMMRAPIIATVEKGHIVHVQAGSPEVEPALEVLKAMFLVDSRYRKVWELGFAINTQHELIEGNTAMNETFGGTDGALHFGLGLTPYTQYHLDIICPRTRLLTDTGDVLIGGLPDTRSGMVRNRGAGCSCIEGGSS